jgi:hypothetical protein
VAVKGLLDHQFSHESFVRTLRPVFTAPGARSRSIAPLISAGRRWRTTAFVRPTAFRGATAGFDFLAALLRPARFRPGLAAAGFAEAAGVAFFGTADFPAALAFPSAAHRLLVAAMIRARP